jgi:ketosteroid isomerase-like protein
MPSPTSTETVIREHEERLRRAMLAGDTVALDALIADDLIFVDHAGRRLTKAMDLEAHRSGLLAIARLDLSETEVRILGGVAVVVTRAALAGRYAGADFAGDFHYTRLWHLGDGRWRVAAAHCSGPL